MNIKNLIETEYNLKFREKCNAKKIEDRWIILKLNDLIKQVVENYNKYSFYKNTELITDFVINDLSRTYIKIVRDRINEKDKSVENILNYALSSVALLSAPVIPYLSEHLYKEMKGKKDSVHLCEFPEVEKRKTDEKLEKEFEVILKIIEVGLAERDKAQIGLKWPLTKIKINGIKKLSKEFIEIIKSQLNVKKIEFGRKKELAVKLDTRLTPALEAEGYAREMSRQVQAFRKKIGLEKKDKIKLIIITDDKFRKILEKQKKFIQRRTNAKKLKIVTTIKERFKNSTEFKIKDKKGTIDIAK